MPLAARTATVIVPARVGEARVIASGRRWPGSISGHFFEDFLDNPKKSTRSQETGVHFCADCREVRWGHEKVCRFRPSVAEKAGES